MSDRDGDPADIFPLSNVGETNKVIFTNPIAASFEENSKDRPESDALILELFDEQTQPSAATSWLSSSILSSLRYVPALRRI